MNRSKAARSAALIALPFLLLPVSIWLGATAAAQLPVLDWRWVVRWSLRAVYVAGAILGYRAGRPRWFYPWLGFAVYEVVATLLVWLAPHMASVFEERDFGTVTQLLLLAFFLFFFTPYFAAVLWVGWQSSRRLLAVYTVFPHAALAFPLLTYVEEEGAIPTTDWMETLPPAAAAAAFAVLFWHVPEFGSRGRGKWARGVVLFAGVPVCQFVLLAGMFGLVDTAGLIIFVITFTVLGWIILCGPLLLPPLVKRIFRPLRVAKAIASLAHRAGQVQLRIPAALRRTGHAKNLPQPVKN